jgi:ABC-type Fe3+-siderophore transport system permease subunit
MQQNEGFRFYTYMVINNTSTSISFHPLIAFNGASVTLEIEHKATKTLITSTVTPTIVGTKVTLTLPSLTTINAVANQLDELNIRVIQSSVMQFEYMAYWIVGSIDQYRQWKSWSTTQTNSKNWITL